ncbi:recombinase family protein [Lacticaseibacillus jixiensis]|uniref:recombinase family protein n=1 Tax=Lacticaseibacillus jixiensis TaxID=3231926 RepID=UPI0036F41DA4
MTVFGYARVSTRGQDLGDQIEQLKREGATEIFSEKFTGTKMDRPGFDKLLKAIQPGDTLLVTKLDRIARNVKGALGVLDDLQAKKVTLRILNLGTFETNSDGSLTPVAKMMRTMLLSFSEFERDLIVERTQSGKAYAKEHDPNYREDRPRRIITPQYRMAYDYLMQGHTYTETERATKLSRGTIYNIKKQIEAEKQSKTGKNVV